MPFPAMAHVDDFDEDIEKRRERAPGSQRLLIITLSVGCAALAISNVVLASRVMHMRSAATLERPVVARAPVEERAVAPERQAPEPPAPAASIPSPPPPPPSRVTTAPEPPPAITPAPARPAVELPARPAPRAQPRVAAATRTSERSSPTPSSPERATASWMVQEYGRLDAETRARAVAEFYDARSPEGAYWRRVLGEIVTARR